MLLKEIKISNHIGELIPGAFSCRVRIKVDHLRSLHRHQERGMGRNDELAVRISDMVFNLGSLLLLEYGIK